MSLYAQAWAEDAPVANVYERAVLTIMAHRSPNKDGSGAFPSIPSMAAFAVCSDRQITRTVKALQSRGLIKEGDQAAAAKIPAWTRPKVYDLMIPYEWYGPSQRREVDEERARAGLPAISAEERPPIQPCSPSRAPRADTGQPKRKPRPALRAVSSANG